ncbi:MAG TPA: hypothetical protein K8W06_04735 [Limosilactobacillus coleohominis]|nr:hypothetical protein [Limosilactobacillus coleohominis]
MERTKFLTDACEALKDDYSVCNSMVSDYKELIEKNYGGGCRVGFHFYNSNQIKTKTLSRDDFYQVFKELDNWLKKHQELNTVSEIRVSNSFAFVDVAITNQPL